MKMSLRKVAITKIRISDLKGIIQVVFLLTASVKKEKVVKGKVDNAVRIATKTMAISNNKINKIKHIGYNRSEIYIKDAVTANRLLDLKDSKEYYVPVRAKRIKGVLIDWDSELPLHELYEAMTEKERRGITQIDRMKRRIYNKEKQANEMVDTNNLILTWEGDVRPDKVSLYDELMSLRVRSYVEAVKQCFNCYKFGHIKTVRRAKQRCIICGKEETHERCEKSVKCANCREEHKSTYRKCKVYKYNMELKKITAENNVSLRGTESLVIRDKPQKMPSLTSKRS